MKPCSYDVQRMAHKYIFAKELGSDDRNVIFEYDDALYCLSWNTSLNYAGLSKATTGRYETESVMFVQCNQHEHIEALDFCEVPKEDRHYYCGENEDMLLIAQLCADYPEAMCDYFLQWE